MNAHALRLTTTGSDCHHARTDRQRIVALFNHACCFETRNVRRLWSTGIQTLTLHQVGIIQPAGFNANAHVTWLWLRIGQLDELKLVHPSKTFNANCFHSTSSPGDVLWGGPPWPPDMEYSQDGRPRSAAPTIR